MKQLSTIVSLLLLIIISACTNIELESPIEVANYFKLYGGFHNDHINAVSKNEVDGLYIAGYSENDDNETWAYISKTLSSGMVDWDTTFTNNTNSKAFDILTISDNSILTACAKEYNEDTIQIYLYKITSVGQITDSVSVNINASQVKNLQIIYQENESLQVLSQITKIQEDGETELDYLLIHKLSDDLVFEETFNIALNQQLADKIVVKYESANSLFLAATIFESITNTGTGAPTDVRVMHIDNNNIVWDRNYGVQGIIETCSDLLLNKGNILIAGNYYKSTETSTKMNLLSINTEGTEISNKTITADNFSSNISCSSFIINSNNNYVFCGDVETSTGTTDIILLETDTEGVNIICEAYGSMGESAGKNIGKSVQLLDNSYLIVGEFENINNYDIGIFKTDLMGQKLALQ